MKPHRFELCRISKRYARHGGTPFELRDVSLMVAEGSIVGLMGPSGCGKSTLVGIAAGFVEPDSGSVLLDNVRVNGSGPDRLVIFQDDATLPWLSAVDN